jgi:hypothetical protein
MRSLRRSMRPPSRTIALPAMRNPFSFSPLNSLLPEHPQSPSSFKRVVTKSTRHGLLAMPVMSWATVALHLHCMAWRTPKT